MAGVSGRSLATAIGVSEAAVRKAFKSGRIPRNDDGTFDVERCRAAWGRSTDPARSVVREPANSGARPPVVRTEADARDAIALIARVLQAEGVEAGGTIDYNAARTADTILKAHERDLKMAQRRKELVPMAAVKPHIEKAFVTMRQTIQQLPSRHVPAMAAELGCDPGDLDRVLNRAIAAELEDLSAPAVRT